MIDPLIGTASDFRKIVKVYLLTTLMPSRERGSILRAGSTRNAFDCRNRRGFRGWRKVEMPPIQSP